MSSSQIEYAMQQMKDDDTERLLNQRLEIELIISDLLSDRGEDEVTARACEEVLHLIRNT